MNTSVFGQQTYTPEQIERRAYSVAMNAVRELRVAYNRDSGPWTDDDGRRVNAIFELLHLARPEEIDMARESFPVVAPQQADENPILDAIEQKIALLNSTAPTIDQEVIAAPVQAQVQAKVPNGRNK